MTLLIAATFTDSLARLTGDEQKAAKTTAFDLQLNPANPGMSFHKLDAAKDKHFWSIRVSADLRIIVHRSADNLLLCYVDHHDKAYAWAERRKLETHPTTGAAQFVEIRETQREVVRPVFVDAEVPVAAPLPLFSLRSDAELLAYGVPVDWLDEVRRATEATLLALTDHLPAEAAEALLELATGGKPVAKPPVVKPVDPFTHPDAQRRFRVMTNVEELERALDYPWDKWTVFLHPEQRQWVERSYSGPARVSGSAGTGKTVVALHRAVFLARQNPDSRVLLTTFSETLARSLWTMVSRLVRHEPKLAERVDVLALNTLGERLYTQQFGKPQIATPAQILDVLKHAVGADALDKVNLRLLVSEWTEVIDAWQLDTWEAYRDVKRLGRKTRLSETLRADLWTVFAKVPALLEARSLVTQSSLFRALTETMAARRNPPYDFTVVDESQDIGVAQLRFLAALGAGRPESLFFAGDLGQRIFQQPFSWRSLGVDIRGRSKTLHINYRTSHQIRRRADRLLGPVVSDVDGNAEERKGTVSVFNGAEPVILTCANEAAEIRTVAEWLVARRAEGVAAAEIGVIVRSDAQLPRALAAVKEAGLPAKVLDEGLQAGDGKVAVCAMHLAKGLEFRAVVVMACDDEVVPLQQRIESITDDADLQEVYDTERHLLYVACTRARDHLLVTSGGVASEFLEDLFVGN
ncbi:MAG: 3'-5' exonuclease [Myxococcota bacterium]